MGYRSQYKVNIQESIMLGINKWINKYMGGEVTALDTIEFQWISVEGMKEIENHC